MKYVRLIATLFIMLVSIASILHGLEGHPFLINIVVNVVDKETMHITGNNAGEHEIEHMEIVINQVDGPSTTATRLVFAGESLNYIDMDINIETYLNYDIAEMKHGLYRLFGFIRRENTEGDPGQNQFFNVTFVYPYNLIPSHITSQIIKTPIQSASQLETLTPENIHRSTMYSDGLFRPVQTVSHNSSPMEDPKNPGTYMDIYSIQEYDEVGREEFTFLPFPYANDGEFIDPDDDPRAILEDFYDDSIGGDDTVPSTSTPYSRKKFDHSPLNIIVEQGAPGETWQPNPNDLDGHTVKTKSSANDAQSVIYWKVVKQGGIYYLDNAAEGGDPRYYNENALSLNIITDENEHVSKEYANKDGLKIMVETENQYNGVTKTLRTYYVHDERNRLRFIIPPQALEECGTNYWQLNYGLRDQYITEFQYDNRDRLIMKKLPEVDEIRYVYDDLDRVIMSQDGNLRNNGAWTFTKYDVFGRIAYTGITWNYLIQAEIINEMEQNSRGDEPQYEVLNRDQDGDVEYDDEFFGYTNCALPTLGDLGWGYEILSVNYYDNYNMLPYWNDAEHDYSFNYEHSFGVSPFDRIKGKPTASMTKVMQETENDDILSIVTADSLYMPKSLREDYTYVRSPHIRLGDGFEATGGKEFHAGEAVHIPQHAVRIEWLKSVQYYDKYGRVIQSIGNDHFDNMAISDIEYDFIGKVLQTHKDVIDPFRMANIGLYPEPKHINIGKRFFYDHADRLKKTFIKVDDQNVVLLSNLNYNSLGQLVSKQLHVGTEYTQLDRVPLDYEPVSTAYAETIEYRYNIRGWMTSIGDIQNPSTFAMEMKYEDVTGQYDETNAQYNGNISAVNWTSGVNKDIRTYSYFYDDINQLTEAAYAYDDKGWVTTLEDYSLSSITYDLNGNIKTASRMGTEHGTPGTIDNLTYTYDGNKLVAVDDACSYGEHDTPHFDDYGSDYTRDGIVEYEYDDGGNMIHDENKGIDIEYNRLNLPKLITFHKARYEDFRIEYSYAYNGAKLRKNTYNDDYYNGRGNLTSTKDYVGSTVYKDGVLKFIFTSEGRIAYNATNDVYEFIYDVKDYLGNTRVSFKPTAARNEIMQEDHYYPFGMKMAGLSQVTGSPETKFTYNGKELEDDFNLNWYHYGARYYDPQLGRWLQVDPADEFHSPYVYCANNPINCVDPDGSQTYSIYEKVDAVSSVYQRGTDKYDTLNSGGWDPKSNAHAQIYAGLIIEAAGKGTPSLLDAIGSGVDAGKVYNVQRSAMICNSIVQEYIGKALTAGLISAALDTAANFMVAVQHFARWHPVGMSVAYALEGAAQTTSGWLKGYQLSGFKEMMEYHNMKINEPDMYNQLRFEDSLEE